MFSTRRHLLLSVMYTLSTSQVVLTTTFAWSGTKCGRNDIPLGDLEQFFVCVCINQDEGSRSQATGVDDLKLNVLWFAGS